MSLAGVYLTHKGPYPVPGAEPGAEDVETEMAQRPTLTLTPRSSRWVTWAWKQTATRPMAAWSAWWMPEALGVARPSPRGRASERGGHPQTPRPSPLTPAALSTSSPTGGRPSKELESWESRKGGQTP